MITIASALDSSGCDVIASLPADRGRSALPITAAGIWSRLPKAEQLTPEGLMPRWPSPVTRYVPLTFAPRTARGAVPTSMPPLPTYQVVNLSTNVHPSGQLSLWASEHLSSDHSPRIDQLLAGELGQGETGESTMIDE